ncbi:MULTISPECIES: hypothetical protein [Actinoplanes]|uniref:hypothetical protein n=1 Tax=Actinoplanes TaxID=1865 RepID=UPI0005F2DFCF|nr:MULTISPECIES: hypothetical protein [Actinoplanes]GLY03395.1 hypothetical protein Acsp01_37740 [Actinoplanes sp. NBRC 101535]
MGTLVTLHLPAGSPVAALPWVITFGSLGDQEEWEPVVCGPYERAHALALAREVVADDELLAVVEPLLVLDGVDAVRAEIGRLRAEAEGPDHDGDDLDVAVSPAPVGPPDPAQIRAGWRRIAEHLTA